MKNNHNPKKNKPVVPQQTTRVQSTVLTPNERLNLLDSILNSSTEYSIIAIDLNGDIVAWNEGARRLYGYEPQDILGKNAGLLNNPEDLKNGLLTTVIEETRVLGKWQGQMTRVKKDGSQFVAIVTVTPRKDQDNVLTGFTVISRDLTSQIKLEEQVKLTQALEIKANQIQEANRLKSEFLANMSHELRTPLNAIIGFSELLYDGKIDQVTENQRECLHDILTSSRHLLHLINDILDLSKIESGKIEFHPERVEIAKLVSEVTDSLHELVNKKRIYLSVSIDDTVKTVYIDPIRFKQILYNYLSNAFKFTPELGSVSIRIKPESNAAFRLEVEDNGVGIKPEDINKLFIAFQQVDSSVAKKYPGTGLGLALTKRTVEAQGGTVGVISGGVGTGSIFYAVLPIAHRSQLTEDEINEIKKEERLVEKEKDFQTVLVVEDDQNEMDWLVSILSAQGYVVESAPTGERAVRYCQNQLFDFITLDLLLPDLNGWDVLKKIREGVNQFTPVFIISVKADHFQESRYWVNDFLTKPIDKDQLIGALQQIGYKANQPCKLLAIDDDHNSLKLIKQLLKDEGFELLCASDVEEGLQLTIKENPNVIVLDLVMQQLNGFDFLKKLRAKQSCKHIPVIVWTVKDLTDDERMILKNSAQAVIQKGIGSSSKHLVREIKKFIKKNIAQ